MKTAREVAEEAIRTPPRVRSHDHGDSLSLSDIVTDVTAAIEADRASLVAARALLERAAGQKYTHLDRYVNCGECHQRVDHCDANDWTCLGRDARAWLAAMGWGPTGKSR